MKRRRFLTSTKNLATNGPTSPKISQADPIIVLRTTSIRPIESISDGFLLFDENGKLLLHNNVFADMYPKLRDILEEGVTYEEILRVWAEGRESFPDGMDRESYIGKCLEAFENRRYPVSQSDEDQLSDGRWAVVRQSPVNVGGLVGVWHDVTAMKQQQNVYKELALTDGLTKLPNRTAFMQRLDHAIKANKRAQKNVALMFVDLDKFKPINDTHGHDAGDHVLVTVSERLTQMIRETDMAARIGGDEFVVILDQVTEYSDIEKIAQKILDGIREPIMFNDADCTVGGSIVNADPASELPAMSLLLDAELEIKSTSQTRTIPAEELFITYMTTSLESDEVLASILFKAPPADSGWGLHEVARRAGDFALVGSAAILALDEQKKCTYARVVLFGVAATPVRA